MVIEARPPLHIQPLDTQRLALTPLDPAGDAPALHGMLADAEVHRFDTDARVSESVEETERRLRLQVAANGGASWAIRLPGQPAIGTIGVFADQGTTIRGVGWSLVRARWGQGITGEAAKAVIPFLLDQAGVDGVEAWIDARNVASLGVARAAGMAEGGRLPRSYADRVGQTVVMVRAAAPREPEVFGVCCPLQVTNLTSTVALLTELFDLQVAWSYPDPPTTAFLAVAPWSGSPGFQVEQAPSPVREGQRLSFDVGVLVDEVEQRVLRAGLDILEVPREQPWSRREMSFRLPGGPEIRVSGPSAPTDAG